METIRREKSGVVKRRMNQMCQEKHKHHEIERDYVVLERD